jgi:hypothetical protein
MPFVLRTEVQQGNYDGTSKILNTLDTHSSLNIDLLEEEDLDVH